MSKEITTTRNGDGTTTKTVTVTKSDGSGTSRSHTYKDGFIFQDTVSRSEKSFGPPKNKKK